MIITATQTRSEFAKNTLRVFFYRGTGRFLLLMSAGFLVVYLFQWLMVPLAGWGAPAIYLLVAGIGFLTLLPALIYRKASMVYDANPLVNQPVDYTFSSDGVRSTGEGIDADIPWKEIFLIAELKEAIVLYYTPQIANPIPKRNFTPEQLEYLRALAESAPVTADMG